MQQTCVDDVLMGNYTDVNDTESLINETSMYVDRVSRYRCEPFNCNDNGRCDNASCICNSGTVTSFCAVISGPPRIIVIAAKQHCFRFNEMLSSCTFKWYQIAVNVVR